MNALQPMTYKQVQKLHELVKTGVIKKISPAYNKVIKVTTGIDAVKVIARRGGKPQLAGELAFWLKNNNETEEKTMAAKKTAKKTAKKSTNNRKPAAKKASKKASKRNNSDSKVFQLIRKVYDDLARVEDFLDDNSGAAELKKEIDRLNRENDELVTEANAIADERDSLQRELDNNAKQRKTLAKVLGFKKPA